MLIINADDFGRSQVATDTILRCFGNGSISTVSGMVFMEDSERAASEAIKLGLDVGLHLNLSENFSGRGVPKKLCQQHARIRQFLKCSKYALLIYHPGLRFQFEESIRTQILEFIRVYGAAPTRIDGHQHMHLCSNILLGKLLPVGGVVRRSFTFDWREKSLLNRAYRAWVDNRLSERHCIVDHFFALSQSMNPKRLASIFAMASKHNVELMTHPEILAEERFLGGALFGNFVKTVNVGTFQNVL